MRESCLWCVMKHLAQAIVLEGESALGYPMHRWIAFGHLAEAEVESVGEYPELAAKIRETRLYLSGQQYVASHLSLTGLLKEAHWAMAKEIIDSPVDAPIEELPDDQ